MTAPQLTATQFAMRLEKHLPAHLARYATQLTAAQLCFATDAYLLAAIMDRESRGGDACKPKGPAGVGDGGRGHGLMQIDVRYHPTFIALKLPDGTLAWQDPAWNIMFGASLLHDNLLKLRGDLAMAVAAYNASIRRVRWAISVRAKDSTDEAVRIAALDSVTTSGNYVSAVLKKQASFLARTEQSNGQV